MNSIRCPGCGVINQMSAVQCKECQFPFGNLPQSAYVSAPTEQVYQAQYTNFPPPPPPLMTTAATPQDNEIGRKAYFWYRFYCGFMVALYLLVSGFGVFLATTPGLQTRQHSAEEIFISGIVYALLGVVLAAVFGVAFFLPRKPWNWIVGIVMIALGLTSCCFLPFLIPLIIYWVKPETKAYFGRI